MVMVIKLCVNVFIEGELSLFIMCYMCWILIS